LSCWVGIAELSVEVRIRGLRQTIPRSDLHPLGISGG
jgi:hypothetical protein